MTDRPADVVDRDAIEDPRMGKRGPKPTTDQGSRRDLPRLTVPMTTEERAALEELAARWGCSATEAVRRAVGEAWSRGS